MNYTQNRHSQDESLQNLFDIKALLGLIQKLNEWRENLNECTVLNKGKETSPTVLIENTFKISAL